MGEFVLDDEYESRGERVSLHFEQSYVDESNGKTAFTAQYVVYDARADGEIPDANRLGETDDEIRAARWFQTPPDALHDGDLLGQYLE
ncbi:hypothetical protein GOC74_16015 [Halomicrobium mukohataei]|uniref:Uncharacterized protein n=1 Tax=Halomicrobium mukohataei TaxID=57705 RepID=A0A847UIM6_9EURY|nr:hypothetical protein [Halomicrobium mukohataei]NLV11434.1 hypothetical protein [Halomicrobium mukohataei]